VTRRATDNKPGTERATCPRGRSPGFGRALSHRAGGAARCHSQLKYGDLLETVLVTLMHLSGVIAVGGRRGTFIVALPLIPSPYRSGKLMRAGLGREKPGKCWQIVDFFALVGLIDRWSQVILGKLQRSDTPKRVLSIAQY